MQYYFPKWESKFTNNC